MAPSPGRALLAVALAAQLPLFLFLGQPLVGWLVGFAAVLLCRLDWDLRPAVPVAAAVMVGCIAGAMAGQSITLGSAQGPVASVGGPEPDTAPLEMGLLVAVAAAGAVLTAWSTDLPVRRLGQVSLAMVGLLVLLDLTVLDAHTARFEVGSLVINPGVLFLLVVVPHGMVLAALAVAPARGLLSLLRRGAGGPLA